jgi:hypothetical protein
LALEITLSSLARIFHRPVRPAELAHSGCRLAERKR